MSIQSAFEAEGIDFTYMNPPEDGWDGVADVKTFQNGKYVVCPYCGKKNLKVLPETKIHMLPMKCKGSSCRKEFLVNVG